MSEESEKFSIWLKWFWEHADFGPAHDDVIFIMYGEFKRETGLVVPEMEESWPGA